MKNYKNPVFFFVCMLLFSCTQNAQNMLQTFSNDKDNFTVFVPNDWETKSNIPNVPFVAIAPKNLSEESAYRANLNLLIIPLKEDETESMFIKKNIDGLHKKVENFQEISSEIILGKNNRTYKVISYHLTDGDEILSGILAITFFNNKAYFLTCLSESSKFYLYKAQFYDVVTSLKIG
jgi:hypothetical protein